MAAPLLSLIPWRVLGIGAAVVGATLYFGHIQREVGRAEIRSEWAEDTKKRTDAALAQAKLDIENASKRAIEFQREVEKVASQREPVVKYVNRYVAKDPTASVVGLSDSWVRGHDGAALNIDPDSLVSGLIDRAPGGATNGQVLQTVNSNYSLALQWRQRLHYARVELATCQRRSPEWIKANLPAP